jgi:hypothetical protein
MASSILNVCGQCHRPAALTPEHNFWYPVETWLGLPQFREEKNCLALPGSEPRAVQYLH